MPFKKGKNPLVLIPSIGKKQGQLGSVTLDGQQGEKLNFEFNPAIYLPNLFSSSRSWL